MAEITEQEQGFQLQSITIGRKLNFSYQRSNPNHEKHKDQYTYKCADKWHPDLQDSVNELITAYMKELGFPSKNDAWSGLLPRKIQVRGLRVACDVKIEPSWSEEDDDKIIEVKGFFVDGLGEYVKDLVAEAQSYIDGRKRKQGDLFQNKNAFIEKKLRKKDSKTKDKEEKAVEDHEEAIADA